MSDLMYTSVIEWRTNAFSGWFPGEERIVDEREEQVNKFSKYRITKGVRYELNVLSKKRLSVGFEGEKMTGKAHSAT